MQNSLFKINTLPILIIFIQYSVPYVPKAIDLDIRAHRSFNATIAGRRGNESINLSLALIASIIHTSIYICEIQYEQTYCCKDSIQNQA